MRQESLIAGVRRLWPLAAVLVVALIVAGCGSSSSTSSSAASSTASSGGGSTQFSAVDAEVEKLQQRPTQIPITTPFKGTFPKGKVIDYLQCSVPACVELGEYLQQAAAAVGWKVNVVNEGATPESVKAAWEKAISDKPSGIVPTGGFPRQIYAAQLAEAKSASIPVIGHSEAVPAEPSKGFVSEVSGSTYNTEMGTAEANWIIAHTKGKAEVLFINSGYPINGLQLKGIEAQFAKECPSTCKVNSYLAPITSIGKDLAGKIATQLQAKQSTNYLVPAFGDMAVGVPAALAGAGVSPVPVISQDQGVANIADIKAGKINGMWAAVGPESMWSVVDTFARIFTNQPYPSEIPAVKWWITAANIPSGTQFPSVAEYEPQFKTLWGLG